MLDDKLPEGREREDDDRAVGDSQPDQSLTDDISALIEDGKTYVEAELAYQKSRLAFVADRGKAGALLGLAALACVHLALVALVVGLLIGLSPLLGPLGATAAVTAGLLGFAAIAALLAKSRFGKASRAFEDDKR